MEDRFRFRFWHNEYKKLVPVYQLAWELEEGLCIYHAPIVPNENWTQSNNTNENCVLGMPSNTIIKSKLSDGILEQCIGEVDDNGNPIYENDILRLEDNEGELEEDCFYTSAVGRFGEVDIRGQEYDSAYLDCYYGFNTCEVIGNIHENKELLKND